MTTATMTNGHNPLSPVASTADEAEPSHSDAMVRNVVGDQVVLTDSMVLTAKAEEMTISEGMVAVALSQGNLAISKTGSLAAAAGRDLALTNGGTGMLIAGRDASLTSSGAGFLLAGRDLTVDNQEEQSTLVAAGTNVTLRGGKVGLLLAGNASLEDGTHVQVALSPQKLVDAALMLAAVPFAVWRIVRSGKGGAPAQR